MAVLPPTRVSIQFGVFEVDFRAGELRKRGVRIKLQEQPFQVLQALLEQPGQVVTREELQQKIWPADTFVDFDHGLNNAVRRLREALCDSAENPVFVETLAKRGYRFIGAVLSRKDGASTPSKTEAEASIAVLPFTNMSPDVENEFLADGITEEIINALAQIEQLHVAARSSAFSFKGKHADLHIIGDRLHVATVLTGSVRRAGNRLRVTVQLQKVADGYQLWSERYDREMKDVFDIQDEITRSIVERLTVTLEGGQQAPLVRVGTKNLEAYQCYLQGHALLCRRGSAILHALGYFKRAVALDPGYALAWAGLADSHTVVGYSGLARPEVCMPRAMEAAQRAVALDPALAEAHNAVAISCLLGAWDKPAAERAFIRALELNPRCVQARDWYAVFYLQAGVGRLEEGVRHAKIAVETDPHSSYTNSLLGLAYIIDGRTAEAVPACKHAVELDSESFLARYSLHIALHLSGRFEEAVAEGELALAISGRHCWAMATLATTFADWGNPVDALAVYAEMTARAQRYYLQPSQLAIAASAAGMRDEAISHAREAFQIRDPMAQLQLTLWWPYAERLRADPQFAEFFVGDGGH